MKKYYDIYVINDEADREYSFCIVAENTKHAFEKAKQEKLFASEDDFQWVFSVNEIDEEKYNIKTNYADVEGNVRLVTLSDGGGMGDVLYIFRTNAPVEELQNLETISKNIYINGNCEDVPCWASVLEGKGFAFDYLDECRHITPYGTSNDWLERKYPQIKEHYSIT